MQVIYHGKERKAPNGKTMRMANAWNICHPTFSKPLLLIPGANTVTEAEWNAVKDMVDVKDALKNRWLEVIEPEKGAKLQEAPIGGTTALRDLKALNVGNAKKMVENCSNVEALKRWAAEDDRTSIHEAIKEQLKRIADLEKRNTPNGAEE